jgi:hypothetical protein
MMKESSMATKKQDTKKQHHEFKVVIEGVELSKETLVRIDESVRKAVLIEMASVDLRGNDLVFSPIMAGMVSEAEMRAGGNGGSTGGIEIRLAQAERGRG